VRFDLLRRAGVLRERRSGFLPISYAQKISEPTAQQGIQEIGEGRVGRRWRRKKPLLRTMRTAALRGIEERYIFIT